MLLVVHGFASHSEALAFEWAWQHPLRSRHAREAVAALAGGGRGTGTAASSGARGRVRALFAMLNAPAWRDMPLTVTLLSSAHEQLVAAALPADEAAKGLPRGMRLETAPVETLVVGRVSAPAGGEESGGELLERDPESNSEGEGDEEEGDGEGQESSRCCCCSVCSLPIEPGEDFITCAASAPSSSTPCRARSHPECLADSFLARDASGGGVVPTTGECPACGVEASWLDCLGRIETMKSFSSPSPSRSSPAKRKDIKAAAVAAAAAEEESSPEKKKKSSPQRRRRRARVAPKATPEELEAFAVAARENAPPAPPAASSAAATATTAPRASRVSPSKRPRERSPSNGEEEPILIVSSSSEGEEEGEGQGGGGGEKGAPAPAAVASSSSSLLLSPLASRLAALSTPSSFSAGGKLRGGARPEEWPPRIGQQQQQQRGSRARALHVSSSSSLARSSVLAAPPARLPPLPPPTLLRPPPAVATALASSVAAAASRGRFSSARAARALRGLMLF